MPEELLPEWIVRLGIALAIGLLIGLQRESVRADGPHRLGGVRTYALVSVAGFVAAYGWPNQPVFLAGLAVLGLLLTAAFVRTGMAGEGWGITAELAAIVTFLLGGMAAAGPHLPPVAIGVLATLLLAAKQPLHAFIREHIGREEMMAVAKFALVALVVYPLLPDQGFTPLRINPRQIWFMVVLVTAISFFGWFGVRIAGPGRGILIAALFGGMVSSTAVTLAFARLSRERPEMSPPLAGGIVLAGTVMFLRQLVEVAVVNPSLLPAVGALMLPAGLVGAWFIRRNDWRPAGVEIPLANPFEIATALKFGALYGVVLAIVQLAMLTFGTAGVYAAALVSGLAEVDAPTLSLLGLSRDAAVPAGVAAAGILAAGLGNTAAKLGAAIVLGSRQLARLTIWAMGSMLTAGLAAGAVYLLLF
ncbi:MAG: MgtC/SapB family protein [Nitrospirota bacterium]